MTNSKSEDEEEVICPSCNTPGKHLVSFSSLLHGEQSFLTCPNLYDESGKRKPEHVNPKFLELSTDDLMDIFSIISK